MLIVSRTDPINNKMMKSVKELLKSRMDALGITQADLARRLGTESQNINNWKVRNSIPKNQVRKLAAVLGVPESVLIDPSSAKNARLSKLAVVAWESKKELDSDEFFFAPLLEVELSAGSGLSGAGEEESYKLPIRRYTLAKHGISSSSVRMVRVYGDSMADRIPDDSVVAIDTDDTRPRDGKIYAFSDDDLLKVKYLHLLPGGGLRIRSHNPAYPEETLTPEQVADRIIIHGRVFMQSSIL